MYCCDYSKTLNYSRCIYANIALTPPEKSIHANLHRLLRLLNNREQLAMSPRDYSTEEGGTRIKLSVELWDGSSVLTYRHHYHLSSNCVKV